jgi:hypothetical protein
MVWSIMCQDSEGRRLETGEKRDGLGQAKRAAHELAWEMRNTTFYVENEKGRVPAVYHYVNVE